MSKYFIIAIDGPAGSGKSTIAKMVAERLGFIFVDTGAMYRAITYTTLKAKIADKVEEVEKLLPEISMSLKFENGLTRVFIADEEVTEFLRSPEVNSMVSEIAAIPAVRNKLVEIQQELAHKNNLVAEGRDTTTVVYPNADVKVFLTANVDVRAQRRLKEFKEKNANITFEEVKANIAKRDKIDSGRDHSPLRKAVNALEIDSSNTTIEEEVETIIEHVNKIYKAIPTN